MSGPRLHPTDLRRTVLAVFALALLLPGLLDQHGHGGPSAHRVGEPGASTAAYFPAAVHPELPLHLEDAAEGEVRPCTACLQTVKTQAAAPDGTAVAVPPAPRQPLPAARAAALSRPWTTVAAGRAPPLS